MRFGIPENIKKTATKYIDTNIQSIINQFYQKISSK